MKVKRILSNLCIGVVVFSSVIGNVQAENNDHTNEKEVSKSEVSRVAENDDELKQTNIHIRQIRERLSKLMINYFLFIQHRHLRIQLAINICLGVLPQCK